YLLLPARMSSLYWGWLWQHEFWLPPGITWQDMQESEDVHYPQPRDLLIMLGVWVQKLALLSVPMYNCRGPQKLQVIKSAEVHFPALSFQPCALAKEVC
uniref:Uncharacterized protein n=1 Tax=Aquila chrysaetos chrysaetos TaxID=223781 RepID=A0A663EYA0_AQUCH